jgi:hypothetical protein
VFVEPVTRPDLPAFSGSRCSMDVPRELAISRTTPPAGLPMSRTISPDTTGN